MKEFPEYVGKAAFEDVGIPVPSNQLITGDAIESKPDINVEPPVAIKAQVAVSGRGKLDGIRFADTVDEAWREIEDLLDSTIAGKRVDSVLVEEKIASVNELYLSIVADGRGDRPMMILSTEGGQSIEDTKQSKIAKLPVDPLIGVYPYHISLLDDQIERNESIPIQKLFDIANHCWNLFQEKELRLLEINPLGVTASRDLIAMDSKCVIDSAAEFRQGYENVESALTDIEQRAIEEGVDLKVGSGDIGIVSNGAGIAMAILDYIALKTDTEFSGFVDTHGAQFEKSYIRKSIQLLTACGSRAIIVNIQGPFVDCVPAAEAISGVVGGCSEIPIVARFEGSSASKAEQLCKRAGVETVNSAQEAVQKAAKVQVSKS